MPKIIREKVFGVADALVSLCPQASWGLGSSGTYDDIRWQDQSIPLPTEEEINDERKKILDSVPKKDLKIFNKLQEDKSPLFNSAKGNSKNYILMLYFLFHHQQ